MPLRLVLILSIFLSIQQVSAQTNFFQFVARVNALTGTAKTTVVDSFINYHKTRRVPVIEDNYAIFIYNGAASSAAIAGDFTNWDVTASMTKLSGTNFFYYTRQFENNARIDYKIVTNGTNWMLDPLNANLVAGGYGPNSELAMPGYIQPWEIKSYPQAKKGTVTAFTFPSTVMGATYQVKVYLPNGYSSSTASYRSAYFQDGYEYIDLASAVNVLDNLIDSNKITPIIGVFVKPLNRNEEYAGSLRVKYQQFFVNELVPYIDANYRTIKQASARLVLGDSYGANISALISYNYAGTFGNCGLHSSAFQPNNFEVMTLICSGPKKDINFAAVWGTYEPVYQMMRPFSDSLNLKGYHYRGMELPEGHSWGLWRAHIDYILEFIFPYSLNGLPAGDNLQAAQFTLEQNYPNPFNQETVLRYTITEAMPVTLNIYNCNGELVLQRDLGVTSAGSHTYRITADNLASGIYLYRISAGNNSAVKKFVLLR